VGTGPPPEDRGPGWGGRDLLPPAYGAHQRVQNQQFDDQDWPVVEDTPRSTSRPTKRRRLKHPVLTAIGVIVVVLVLLAGGSLLWANSQISPGGKPGAQVAVSIPVGASTSKIGDILASAGVVHEGWLFALYVKVRGDGPLLPGRYSLHRNSSYQSAISALKKGPIIITENLVIPEGFTLHQIADRVAALPSLGLSAQKFLTAASDGSVRSPYEPAGVNDLEGLLFPATYVVRQGETEVELLEQMVGAFDSQADQVGLQAAAQRLGYSTYQLVTVASIVEKEAKLPGDRGPVASVLYNRLHAGMTLGADSTETYYLRLTDPSLGQPTAAQDNQPSPYNTRLNKGLPPTPISNPGLPSLQAATNPPATTYLYFVEINPDGQLGYASTQTGFDHLQAQCRAAGLC
jgi:UPF0755 protein